MSTPTTAGHAPTSGWKEWVLTTDHKRIGVLYLVGSMAAFGIAGIMALIIRMEQMELGMQYVADANQYNSFLYFHGAAMILAFLIPGLTGFAANYFLPLMIGAASCGLPLV